MKKRNITIKGEPLRLEIQPDGNAAGLYEGQLLVIGFKWRDSIGVFEPIAINQEWERALLTNQTFHYYLDQVLKELHTYREEALKLADQRRGIQNYLSGFLTLEHEKNPHHLRRGI